MDKKSIEAEIASYTGKLFRDNFGKGPSSIYVSCVRPFITIHLRDFLAPMEKVLVKQNNNLKVQETRDLLMQELLPDIKATVRTTAKVEIRNIYYDWSLENKTGIILAEMAESDTENDNDYLSYPSREQVHEEIVRFSEKAQKAPRNLHSLMLNPRTLVIVREGILVRIEKELIAAGFEEQLKLSKRRLEKSLLNTDLLESLLGVQIEDIFADWDFSLDKGYIIIIMKPEK
ncbi:DUF2294 domain-containing protein [Sediminibacillus halophilus]|uniref:Uncharacterized protein YbcI n=1 Tax=Sediminibacillus halophilus TaxID=482461 RepID=A0A1G9VI17_9BACI|nr:DUF2294 domain-containing protein [Sediminibacillus halophilus]SDM71727.1 Uncharacterized protein YbcI [Sediminibacillus halophilus]